MVCRFGPALLAVSAVALAIGVDDPEIVLGMLKVVLGGDAIAGCLRVTRQGEIFFQHLVGIAADSHLGPVAVEGLVFDRHMRLAIAAAAGRPITATSANLSGQPATSDPYIVERTLGDHIDLLIDTGATRGGPASTIVDITAEPRLVRAGAISWDDIQAEIHAWRV